MSIKPIAVSGQTGLPAKRHVPVLAVFSGWLLRGLERARQRRCLALLSDHQLRDIGLTRRDVLAETAKPFWRP